MSHRVILYVISVALLWAAGCAGTREPQWAPVGKPIVEPGDEGPAVVRLTCPKCSECHPEDMGISMITLAYCHPSVLCCNNVTENFQCRTTGEYFENTRRDCDDIEWGTMK